MRTNNSESAVDFIINVGASIQKSKRTKAQFYFSQANYHLIRYWVVFTARHTSRLMSRQRPYHGKRCAELPWITDSYPQFWKHTGPQHGVRLWNSRHMPLLSAEMWIPCPFFWTGFLLFVFLQLFLLGVFVFVFKPAWCVCRIRSMKSKSLPKGLKWHLGTNDRR
jgi:hypothetical protein